MRVYLSCLAAKLVLVMGLSFALIFNVQAEGITVKNIVLVHGAFADGSSWSEVTSRLQGMGYHVTSVQNPLTSLEDDVTATRRVLERQQGDVLLVGHSWAGAVITEAGNASNVKGLVYLSALVPDSGESVAGLLQRLNSPMQGMSVDKNGLIWLDDPETFRKVMANDIPIQRAAQLAAAQQPIAARAFNGTVSYAAWRDKPSWYLITENDSALPQPVQRKLAEQTGADVLALNSGHMSMISHPDEVASFIDDAARTIK